MKPKIYLAIINNTGLIPDYFVVSLIRLIKYTEKEGILVEMEQVKANSVEAMRNVTMKGFLESDCTHYMALDVDHLIPEELIIRLLRHCKDIVVPQLCRRALPVKSAQALKWNKLFGLESNYAPVDKEDELVEIEISGPPGMLIKREVIESIEDPWFVREFTKNHYNEMFEIGSDVNFCKRIIEKGYKIYLDKGISLPHNTNGLFVDRDELKYVNPQTGEIKNIKEYL